MRYVQLRAFHSVAVHGGFSRAADALHLTQPAISDQVRKLEEEYDILLFNRRKRQVTVTKEGAKLLEITNRLFEHEQQAQDFLSESRALSSGTLRIVADAAHHMTPALSQFRSKYPGIHISVRSGNSEHVISELYAYNADIGVLGEIPDNKDLKILKLGSTPLVAFAAKGSDYDRKARLSYRELAKLPLVLREPGSKTRQKLMEAASRAGTTLTRPLRLKGARPFAKSSPRAPVLDSFRSPNMAATNDWCR